MKEAFARAGVRVSLSPGAVVTVKDDRISFPKNWIRRRHERRFGVILSNDTLCHVADVLLIAPCTSDLSAVSASDLVIEPTKQNGLTCSTALLVGQIQPILYDDIIEKFGELSDMCWQLVMRKLIWVVDRA